MTNSYKTIKVPKGIKHSLWSIMDAALYPAVYLATVPLMMRGLGMVTFGLWILLNTLITILQLFNFNSGVANMGMATIRNISYALANNDTRHINDIINSTLRITVALFIIITCFGFFLSFAAVRYGWWGVGKLQGLNITLCILLTVVIGGLKYFDQVFQSVIKAYERFRLSSVLNMINRFGLLAITLLLAVNKYSLVQILWANIIFIIVYLAIQFGCIKRIVPAYSIRAVSDRQLYKKLLHFSAWPWFQSVLIVLAFQTDRFWVSSYLGLKEVSSYGLVATMFNHVHMIFTAMALWVLPRIAMMATKGEDPAKLYYLVRAAILGLITVSLLFFYFISPALIQAWVGANTSVYLLSYIKYFVAFEIVFAHTIMPFFYLNAAGKDRLATKLTLLYCGVSYVFMLGGLWLFHSAVAMIAGMTIAMCLTMPAVNGVVQREMYNTYSWKQAIAEMLPMYAAILLLFNEGNVWIYIALAVIVALLLWKFYLSNLFYNKRWQQTPYL
jgi:O-antigen/teichoic acid export membrane protein